MLRGRFQSSKQLDDDVESDKAYFMDLMMYLRNKVTGQADYRYDWPDSLVIKARNHFRKSHVSVQSDIAFLHKLYFKVKDFFTKDKKKMSEAAPEPEVTEIASDAEHVRTIWTQFRKSHKKQMNQVESDRLLEKVNGFFAKIRELTRKEKEAISVTGPAVSSSDEIEADNFFLANIISEIKSAVNSRKQSKKAQQETTQSDKFLSNIISELKAVTLNNKQKNRKTGEKAEVQSEKPRKIDYPPHEMIVPESELVAPRCVCFMAPCNC